MNINEFLPFTDSTFAWHYTKQHITNDKQQLTPALHVIYIATWPPPSSKWLYIATWPPWLHERITAAISTQLKVCPFWRHYSCTIPRLLLYHKFGNRCKLRHRVLFLGVNNRWFSLNSNSDFFLLTQTNTWCIIKLLFTPTPLKIRVSLINLSN
jgi:hypothetical protein